MSPTSADFLPLHLSSIQRRKLQRLLRDAVVNVPLYRERLATAGITERDIADPGVLARLPVVTKQDLLCAPEDARRNRRFREHRLFRESTTGSTGQPFTVWQEPAYVRRRNLRFLAALVASGYRPWHRLMLLTDRSGGTEKKPGNRYYVSVEQTTDAIVDAYQRVRPDVLYGFTTPLRLLADRLRDRCRAPHQPRLLISTAELMDAATRKTLHETFGCPVGDFYGMTEMGLVSWQCPGSDRYIMSPGAVLTEFQRTAADGRFRMIMTNLDLHASPMIRYDTGDLAFVQETVDGPAIRCFEGRVIDTVVARDGSELSPYRITDALRDIPGLRRFKVTQQTIDEFDVAVEIDEAAASVRQRVESVFERLLGTGLQLKVLAVDQLICDGAQKFRPVESRVARR